jgi:hypothetical protein
MLLKSDISKSGGSLYANFFLYLLVALVSYGLLNFVLTKNTLSPLHQDDYLVLGAGYEKLRWLVERPASTNLAYFMGQMGPTFSFALLNFFTATVPALVLYFVCRLLRFKIGWVLAICFGLMVFSHEAAFEHGKYLGLITNLTSHFFGCLALVILLLARQKPMLLFDTCAVIAYGLSVFAKEDFLLPPLLFLFYLGADLYYPPAGKTIEVIDDRVAQKKWLLRISGYFLVLACASVLFGFLVANPFLAGAAGQLGDTAHYAVNVSPVVLIAAFLKLTVGYAPWHTTAGVLAVIALGLTWKGRRREILTLTAMILCLILPYAVIPNHVFVYRVFAWLPWLSALSVVAIGYFFNAPSSGVVTKTAARLFALLMLALVFLYGYDENSRSPLLVEWSEDVLAPIPPLNPSLTDLKLRLATEFEPVRTFISPYIQSVSEYVDEHVDVTRRLMVAEWYEGAQQMNKALLNSILANKALLNNEPVVGVVGVVGLSPWSNNDGGYLRKRLGFRNHWIVFVDKSTMYFTIKDFESSTYLSVASSRKLCERPALLIMKFDSTGMGRPVRARELCNSGEASK